MRIKNGKNLQLTYCTNIHPANGLKQIYKNIEKYSIPLKRKLSEAEPFAIGLRLSDYESRQLTQKKSLQKFKSFLDENGLYVFTINGFVYGQFHKKVIKSKVFTPDWQDQKRVNYTLRLIKILSYLLDKNKEGSISTSPLSYKSWYKDKIKSWQKITKNLITVTSALIKIQKNTGKIIHIDIEPEPSGLLENSDEIIKFFKDYLLKSGVEILKKEMSIPKKLAIKLILEHVRICLDTCHFAVEYEKTTDILQKFKKLGIGIGKIQISSALKITSVTARSHQEKFRETLKHFEDSIYLHQVIAKNPHKSFEDLTYALESIRTLECQEYRIHFHVPIFRKKFGALDSTQEETIKTLSLLKKHKITSHLEIETYTWEVLPKNFKIDLVDSIEREYKWVLKYI